MNSRYCLPTHEKQHGTSRILLYQKELKKRQLGKRAHLPALHGKGLLYEGLERDVKENERTRDKRVATDHPGKQTTCSYRIPHQLERKKRQLAG